MYQHLLLQHVKKANRTSAVDWAKQSFSL